MATDAHALTTTEHSPVGGLAHDASGGISNPVLGMLLFITSEVMFFAGLFAAYFNLRANITPWPPEEFADILQPIGIHNGIPFTPETGALNLILPATTIGLFFMATYARMTRASMLEVNRLDFVKTARAKGLSDTVIQRRHVLRNALLPVVTLAGLQAGTLVGGAVLTETVFAWPGIGRLMYEALLQRDYNLLLGVFVVCSAMVLAFNLITDLVYRSVDPRIEFAS